MVTGTSTPCEGQDPSSSDPGSPSLVIKRDNSGDGKGDNVVVADGDGDTADRGMSEKSMSNSSLSHCERYPVIENKMRQPFVVHDLSAHDKSCVRLLTLVL